MATTRTAPELVRALLNAEQIRTALPKLRRRLAELKGAKLDHWDDAVRNELDGLQKKIEDTLTDIFGPDTHEYKRYRIDSFHYEVPMYSDGTPPEDWLEGYRVAVAKATSTLSTVMEVLEEKLEDIGESMSGQALQAYQGLELHPEIDRAASQLYRDSHYANAIEDAVKALNGLVRLRSGVDDRDGSKLMEHVFSPKNPVLRFNDLADQSDQDEQRGFMMMFSGAVSGLRNPRAHKFIDDDPERALEFIAFVSLLTKLLDKAIKVI